MRIADIMTRNVHFIGPQETLEYAARVMAERDVAFLPVAADGRLVGTLTDRDIVLRVVAPGLDATRLSVADVMTDDPASCREAEATSEVLSRMQAYYFRRLAVLDADGRLSGVVSQSDFAKEAPLDAGR